MSILDAQLLAAASAALGVVGAWLLLRGWRRLPRPPAAPQPGSPVAPVRVAAAVAGAVLIGVATGWPVAAAAAAALGWLPVVWGSAGGEKKARQITEAVAGWAEMLRDTLQSATGVEQSLLATAHLAPGPIRAQVSAAADGLRGGARLPQVLDMLGEQLADPAADLVVAALRHAASGASAGLADRLGALATAAREQAIARERIAAERVRTRTQVRIVVGLTVAMVLVMLLFGRQFLEPYGTAGGQLVLAGVAAMFGFGFWWLHQLAKLRTPPRVLANPDGFEKTDAGPVGNPKWGGVP